MASGPLCTRRTWLLACASQGVANGCWVVDVGWAAACLAAGGHVPEDASEWRVVGDQVGGTCGAEEARRRRLAVQGQGQRGQQQRRRPVRQEQVPAGGDADREGKQRDEGGAAGKEDGEVTSQEAERAASPGASEGGGGGQGGGDASAEGLLLQDVQVFVAGAPGCGECRRGCGRL